MELSLTFNDLQEITIPDTVIEDFHYTTQDEEDHLNTFTLSLKKAGLEEALKPQTFAPDPTAGGLVREYFLATHPSLRTLTVTTKKNQQTYTIDWLITPNNSLADCQCEPANARLTSREKADTIELKLKDPETLDTAFLHPDA